MYGGIPMPPSASPQPSPSSANAACAMHTSRSATFVVAIEHECGKRGIPAMHPSRSSTLTLRKLPALWGMSGSIELNRPMIEFAVAHARDSLSPPA